MLKAFTNPKKVTKSHVLAANATIKIDVPEGQHPMNKAYLKVW